MGDQAKRVTAVVAIELAIAAVFVFGPGDPDHPLSILYHSYFADVAIPFGFYFLLFPQQFQHPVLRPWWRKALAVFALCSTSEILQFFGIYALASVFDPVDLAMYGLGVSLAALVDRQVLARTLAFWS